MGLQLHNFYVFGGYYIAEKCVFPRDKIRYAIQLSKRNTKQKCIMYSTQPRLLNLSCSKLKENIL